MKRVVSLALFTFLLFTSITAQSPESFNYQAVLRNDLGEIISNQSVQIRISVLMGSTNGMPVYTETHLITTNDFGLINFQIGMGTSSDSFSNIDWGNNTFFIKTELDPDGGNNYELFSTQQLVSVPYALHAKTASNVNDADADPLNELQAISISNDTIYLSNGGFAVLPASNNSDNQNLSLPSLTGTTLNLGIENGAGTSIDLAGLQDGTGTDNQSLNFTGTNLSISNGNSVDLSSLQDGVNDADSDPANELQAISISNDTIYLSNGGFAVLPVAAGGDNWGTQSVQTDATISGNGLSGNPLGVIGDLTDDQSLSLTGTTLSISGGNNLDLAILQDGVNDADSDPSNEIQAISISNDTIYLSDGGFVLLPALSDGWSLNGNSGTDSTHFIGTTDNTPLHFRVDSTWAGRFDVENDNFFIGTNSGIVNIPSSGVSGTKNTAVGAYTLASNTSGNHNSTFGYNALQFNTTGASNTAIGSFAMNANTGGFNNVAVGSNALKSNTSGGANVAIGYDAVRDNISGSFNTALGFQSLEKNTTGSSNTAGGASVLTANTTGGSNSAFGSGALKFNTTGDANTAIGAHAMRFNTTGSNNTALGLYALDENTTGLSNTALGVEALRANTTGWFNVSNGYRSLHSNVSGSRNVANGSFALRDNTTGFSNTASGDLALRNNTTGRYNVVTGASALLYSTIGNNNVAIGSGTGRNDSVSNNNVYIGFEAGMANPTMPNALYSRTGNIMIGYQAGTGRTGNNELVIENSASSTPLIYGDFAADSLRIHGNLSTSDNLYPGKAVFGPSFNGVMNMGGGEMTPYLNYIGDNYVIPTNVTGDEDLYIEDDLQVGDQAYKTGGGMWATASDARLKTEVNVYTDGLTELLQISPVSFKYNDKFETLNTGKTYIGIIAQDMQKIAPYMIEEMMFGEQYSENENGEEVLIKEGEAYLTYDGSALTYMTINAIKEQQLLLEEQQAEIEALKLLLKELLKKD